MTKGGWAAIAVAGLAVAATGAVAGQQYATKPALGEFLPAPGAAVATAQPLIGLDVADVQGMRDLRVEIDGVDHTAKTGRTTDGRLVLKSGPLKDGEHTVAVRFGTSNVFARTVSEEWTFTVDTTEPSLRITGPKPAAPVNRREVAVTGTTEPGTTVTVGWKGGSADGTSDDAGSWSVTADLPEGRSAVTVRAADAAGNATVTSRRIVVDTTAPGLRLAKLPPRLTETDAPLISGTVTGEPPARAVVTATVNGRQVRPARLPAETASGDGTVPQITFSDRQFAMSVGRLPQGTNDVRVQVRDAAGNRTVRRVTMTVDSTEDFGGSDLVQGARGADVKALQKQLRERGFKRTKVTGVYDAQTARSVRNYQRVRGINQSGVFGPRTRTAFMGRIVIDLSRFRLTLIRDGKVVRRYSIAHGTSAYPTPTGSFEIINMQKNPTWTPPPGSDWAKGLGPVPPGVGNPLGTRWMGINAPYIGIHGTPVPGSIGTRASHGCIRMRIPEAEALFDQITLGTPVRISA